MIERQNRHATNRRITYRNESQMRTKRSTRAAVVRVLKWMRYPRRQVNAAVNTETARDQCVDRVALFILAVARRRVSLVVDCLPLA